MSASIIGVIKGGTGSLDYTSYDGHIVDYEVGLLWKFKFFVPQSYSVSLVIWGVSLLLKLNSMQKGTLFTRGYWGT